MYTKDSQEYLPRDLIYEMLDKEYKYAHRWKKDKETTVPGFPDNTVSRTTGTPFSLMDWVTFADKYLSEAKEAYANYCPDLATVRIRLIKAASLLVTALQVHGSRGDIERLAGVSSTKFPILTGGLATFESMKQGRIYSAEDGTKYTLVDGKLQRYFEDKTLDTKVDTLR